MDKLEQIFALQQQFQDKLKRERGLCGQFSCVCAGRQNLRQERAGDLRGIQRRLPIVPRVNVEPARAGGEARVRRALPGQKQANIIF